MQRSETTSFPPTDDFPQQIRLVNEASQQHDDSNGNSNNKHETDAIVRNIASFLTVSDAASLLSRSPLSDSNLARVDSSWAVGVDMNESYGGVDLEASSWEQHLMAPETPAFVVVSPGDYQEENHRRETKEDTVDDFDNPDMEDILLDRRRRWVQQRLASAVYSHPGSVRSFCMEAYQSAKDILRERKAQHNLQHDPETSLEPTCLDINLRPRKIRKQRLIARIANMILNNVPLSVLIDVLETTGEVSLDTTFASFTVAAKTLDALVHGLFRMLGAVWHGVTNFNPFQLLEAIVSFQFNAMGKTTEVLASGIQSVATGVGSASSMALHRLSAANLSVATRVTASSGSVRHGDPGLRRTRSSGTVLNRKLLKKLSAMNDAARVVRYMESTDETGGLTKHARSKVQRMMHYEVSLRPFVATVRPPNRKRASGEGSPISLTQPPSSVAAVADKGESPSSASISPASNNSGPLSDASTANTASPDNINSPFVCWTPTSFPNSPHTRQIVMAKGGKFADDIVFLARDRLRLHDSLESENERTREMAKLLREGKRLAVFNARDVSNGIELTCGQHIATKAGNMLYCTARSMVPCLRNNFVYFEITVLPRSFGNMALQPSMTTLSIGLSTEEMPANALVGAWQGSCGLCTTGQIFAGGEWCTPSDPSVAAYTDGATVGCLVYLDDASAEDTWEGVLVNATATFNVNGFLVAPVLSSSIGATTAAPSAVSPTRTIPSEQPQHVSTAEKPEASPAMGMPLDDDENEDDDLGSRASSALKQNKEGNDAFSKPSPGIQQVNRVDTLKEPPITGTIFAGPGLNSVAPDSSPFILSGHQPPVTLSIKVPAAEELYPTVTLHSPATSVMCRFSAEDIVASTKETIGAPMHSTVYAVDGSVIFV
mmetsp:Transcript_1382/g.3784  ORF Transcript_1382/g.3784 Transcript_1382/m.3784 type:complete len:889 (-) Transcript_1382:1081-3747(-)